MRELWQMQQRSQHRLADAKRPTGIVQVWRLLAELKREDVGAPQQDGRLARKCLHRAVRVKRRIQIEAWDVEGRAEARQKVRPLGVLEAFERSGIGVFLSERPGKLRVAAAVPPANTKIA